MTQLSFESLEAARQAANVSVYALCREAGINDSTWRRIRLRGGQSGNVSTFRKLWSALDRFRQNKRQDSAVSAGVLAAAFKAYLLAAAAAEGLKIDDVLIFDHRANRPRDPEWLRVSRARQAAVYLTVTEHNVPMAVLADAIGVSKQAISKSQRSIEWRRDDPAFDELLDRIAELMKGRAA